MKYLPLLFAGIARNRTRSVLVATQVVLAFMLFGMLQGLNASMLLAIRHSHAERMFVVSKMGGGDLLPVRILATLQKVPGVARVTFESQLPCVYRRPGQYVWALGIDPQSYFAVYYENKAPRAQLEAFEHTRTGALLGTALAKRFGWKVGDYITLQCFVPQVSGSKSWELDIVGNFQQIERPEFSDLLLINYDYLNEARAISRDSVNVFGIAVVNPADAGDIGHTIDSLFASSPNPTQTESDSAAAQASFRRIGDVGFLASSVSSAALCALLVAVGALAMQAIGERRRELAIMKALGFSDAGICVLVLAEAQLVWIAAALLGLGLAAVVLPRAQHLVGQGVVPLTVVAAGVLYAAVLSALCTCVPAWQGSQTSIVAALSER